MERQLHEKISPNWLGPYIIKRKFYSKAYHLVEFEGNEECEPINIMQVHKINLLCLYWPTTTPRLILDCTFND